MIFAQIAPAARAIALGAGLAILAPRAGQAQAAQPEIQGNVPNAQAEPGAPSEPTCASPLPQGPRTELFVPPEKPVPKPERHRRNQEKVGKGRLVLTDDPTPTLQPDTATCTEQAAIRYRQIAGEGGWPEILKPLQRKDAAPDEVERLRRRLSIEGDLPQQSLSGDAWDDALTEAVKNFQRRSGLEQTGEVDRLTLTALNVPADVRANELEASAKRIANMPFSFDEPMLSSTSRQLLSRPWRAAAPLSAMPPSLERPIAPRPS